MITNHSVRPDTALLRPSAWLWLVVALACLPLEVRAQEIDPRADAAAHLGPVYVAPSIVLEDLGYDSNVFNTSGPAKVSDFTFMLTPQIAAGVASRTVTLAVLSRLNMVYFATQQQERSVNHDFAANGRVVLNRVALSARGTYVNTRRRLNEEIDTRSKRLEAEGEFGAQVAMSRKTAVAVGGRLSSFRFDDTAVFDNTILSETLNRDSTAENASFRYALTPISTLVTMVEFGQDRFVKSPIRDADTRLLTTGFSFNPRAVISGSAQFGYERLTPRTATVPVFSGFVTTVNVGVRLRETTQLGIMATRRPGYSYSELQPYYALNTLGASVRRQLAASVDLELSGGLLAYVYRPTTPLSPGQSCDCGDQTLWNSSAVVGYTVNRHARWSLGVAYRNRTSKPRTDFSFNQVRVGASVVYKF